MKNLEDQVPPGYFDDFANQTLARLEDSMPDERKDAVAAQSAADAILKAAAAPPAAIPPAPAATPAPAASASSSAAKDRDEDSGLPDISNLASSQRCGSVKRSSQPLSATTSSSRERGRWKPWRCRAGERWSRSRAERAPPARE